MFSQTSELPLYDEDIQYEDYLKQQIKNTEPIVRVENNGSTYVLKP